MNVVLQSIVTSAGTVAEAAQGWVLAPRPGGLEVVAAVGAGELIGRAVPAEGSTAAYVLAAGQPVAMLPRADDPATGAGVAALLGVRPGSVLCVPCVHDDEVLGVLELVDKTGGGPFSFDDVELVTVLAGIAGAALQEGGDDLTVPSPDDLATELRRLAGADPTTYATVARAVDALLARG